MKRKISILFPVFLFLGVLCGAQNIGIATSALNRSRFEVAGGSFLTAGIFGNTNGISVQRNPPALGFNEYSNAFVGNGHAAKLSFNLSASSGFNYVVFGNGTANAPTGSGITAFRLGTGTGSKIQTSAVTDPIYVLDIGRGPGFNGTVQFNGTNYNSHFNYGTSEDTYIRGGKPGSRVYLNDVLNGRVNLGGGSSIIGVNYNNPVYTFEVRQTGGTGLKIGVSASANWEWRVAGSPGEFRLLYAGVMKTKLSPVNGSLNPVSDMRLKRGIEDLDTVLYKLLQLEPVTYEMKANNPNHYRTIGFIAQDAAGLFPQLVYRSPEADGLHSVNYSGFSVLAVKAVQEEQAVLKQLEKYADNADSLMDEIERKCEQLKRKKR